MKKLIYFDNAATTAVKPEILDKMIPFFMENYGNPSAVHTFGMKAKFAIDGARQKIASYLNCETDEIYFTSGGSESDNWVIKNTLNLNLKNKHIITTMIEHPAILNSCAYAEKHGVKITYIRPDGKGIINPKDIKNAITNDTVLISVMAANNEIGTVEPIDEIGKIAHSHGIKFHSDAVQLLGNVDIDLKNSNIDFMSFSAHKIHGPKGTGALYIKKGTNITPFIDGGGQEHQMRSGTENVAGTVGFAFACELLKNEEQKRRVHCKKIRDYFLKKIISQIPDTIVTGDLENRIPTIASFCFKNIESNQLLTLLNMSDLAVSAGSACSAGSVKASHVISAIQVPFEYMHGALRVSISDMNTEEEARIATDIIINSVKKLRK